MNLTITGSTLSLLITWHVITQYNQNALIPEAHLTNKDMTHVF